MLSTLPHRKQFVINTLRLERFKVSLVKEKGELPCYLTQVTNYKATAQRLMHGSTYQPAEIPPLTTGLLFISLCPEYCDKIFFEAVVEGAVCRFDVTQCLNLLDPVIVDTQLQHDPLPNCPLYAAYLSQGMRYVKTREDGTQYFDFVSVDNFGMFTLNAGMDALEIRDLLTNQSLPLNFKDPRFKLNPCAKLENLLLTQRVEVWRSEQVEQALESITLLTQKPTLSPEGVVFFIYSWGVSRPRPNYA